MTTQERKQSTVRASDGAPASHADIGIDRRRDEVATDQAEASLVRGPGYELR